jgi:DNA-binding beta-propeller fold protein YncE
MALTAVGSVAVPPFRESAFDHGDVHLTSGRIFIAHTNADSVEVLDGEERAHLATIPGCPEASGVLCAQREGAVFAAARGAGEILVIDVKSLAVLGKMRSGPRPNGLAWDGRRRLLLAADIQDLSARLLDPRSGEAVAKARLPGRPRWCVYDQEGDRFLVNVREPACVALLSVEPFALSGLWPVSSSGPHGLDLDPEHRLAFVTCDGGTVSVLDLRSGGEVRNIPIAGPPDATWYNPQRRRLYVAIGNPGVIDVIDTVAMTRSEQVITEAGAKTTAFDPLRQQLAVFLPSACRAALYRER